jgi:phage antirepressor protein|nr:MAG TPA: AntA/AntB antirepressor [Caudoviricetes sp.]
MDELIRIKVNDKQEQVIEGGELHKVLDVSTAYKDWFPRMREYGFTEGEDFCSILSESTGGRLATNHLVSIDMAKEHRKDSYSYRTC